MVHRTRPHALPLALTVALALAIAAPTAGAAQTPTASELAVLFGPPATAVGVRAGYEFGLGARTLGIHGRVPVGPADRGVLIPSGDLLFGPDRIDWQLNADVAIAFGALRLFYAGAGVAVLERDFDGLGEGETATGLNLLTGLEFPRVRGRVRAVLELRATRVRGGWPTRLMLGAHWRV